MLLGRWMQCDCGVKGKKTREEERRGEEQFGPKEGFSESLGGSFWLEDCM
jgi:hypothetical protein